MNRIADGLAGQHAHWSMDQSWSASRASGKKHGMQLWTQKVPDQKVVMQQEMQTTQNVGSNPGKPQATNRVVFNQQKEIKETQ